MPLERPLLVGEVVPNLRIKGVAWSAQRIPPVVSLGFLDRSRYYFSQVAPQLSSRGWVDPVPDPLLLRKSGSAGNQTRDLWICSQKLSTRLQRRSEGLLSQLKNAMTSSGIIYYIRLASLPNLLRGFHLIFRLSVWEFTRIPHLPHATAGPTISSLLSWSPQ
jgi:hypothetical protein